MRFVTDPKVHFRVYVYTDDEGWKRVENVSIASLLLVLHLYFLIWFSFCILWATTVVTKIHLCNIPTTTTTTNNNKNLNKSNALKNFLYIVLWIQMHHQVQGDIEELLLENFKTTCSVLKVKLSSLHFVVVVVLWYFKRFDLS